MKEEEEPLIVQNGGGKKARKKPQENNLTADELYEKLAYAINIIPKNRKQRTVFGLLNVMILEDKPKEELEHAMLKFLGNVPEQWEKGVAKIAKSTRKIVSYINSQYVKARKPLYSVYVVPAANVKKFEKSLKEAAWLPDDSTFEIPKSK